MTKSRSLSGIIIVLFCLGILFLEYGGESLRTFLAPKVYLHPITFLASGIAVPAECLHIDENTGETYVFIAMNTGKFPEGGYEAVRYSCVVITTDNEVCLLEYSDLSFNSPDWVIGASNRRIISGCRVIPE